MGFLTDIIKKIQAEEMSEYFSPAKKSRVENPEEGDITLDETQDREAGLFHPKQHVLELDCL